MSGYAIAYILSIVNIHAAKLDLQKHWAVAQHMGILLTGAKKVEDFDEMVKKQMAAWMIKILKLLTILNPDFGDFLKTCGQIHAFCVREKQVDHPTGACRVDRARIFLSTNINPKLHCDLLVA